MKISVLFTDIGGVLLTNGWDTKARTGAAEKFNLDFKEFNDRHIQIFDTFEEGKLSLNEYLERVIFHKKRAFSLRQFKNYMFSVSEPYAEMIKLYRALKEKYNLKIIAINNESRELNNFRVKSFGLSSFIDTFVSSCYVHYRKPDKDIFKIALDIIRAKPEESLFIDDRKIFVEVSTSLGINGIHHIDYISTLQKLSGFGLKS